MDCSSPGTSIHRDSPGKNFWSGLPHSPPGDLSNSEIKLRYPALQVDFLPTESPGKPKNIGVCSLTLLQGIFPTQDLNQGLLHCRQILYQLSYKTVQKRAQRGEERREKWYYLGL